MASQALQTSKSLPRPRVHQPVNRTLEHGFFAGMAVLLCAVVFIGFSPTYFAAGLFRAPLPSRIVHVHGAIFTLWMILYVVQSSLISAHRVAWHRTLGTIAFCLPPIMIVLGVVAALEALNRGARVGPLSPAVTLAIPLFAIATFAIVILASWRARRKPDTHKRLALLATVGLTGAALGRFPWIQMGLSPTQGPIDGLGILMLLLVVYDLFSLHRVHRSTMWAAPLTFVLAFFAVPIGMTSGWQSFAALLAKTFPHV